MIASCERLIFTLSIPGILLKLTSDTAAQTPHEIPVVRIAIFSTCAPAGSAIAAANRTNVSVRISGLPLSIADLQRNPAADKQRVYGDAGRKNGLHSPGPHRRRPAVYEPELVRERSNR